MTEAQTGASSPKVAVAAAVAVTISNRTVDARLGTGATVTTTGTVGITATLSGPVTGTAAGASQGDASVGAAIVVTVANHDVTATTLRSIDAGGAGTGAHTFDEAFDITRRIYDYQGKGHSVSLHSKDEGQALRLGLELPVARVIVNQAHCFATGGNFDNGLPFSLSMGCGTWGRNSFSDNMHWRHFLNITRISRVIPARTPTEQEIFGGWFAKYGR